MKIYNTLSKMIEEFKPLHSDHANMYTCGPTVYNYAHIGNLRSYIMADLLYRTLKLSGLNPRWTMNVTDIDDKTIKGAISEYGEQATVSELNKYTQKYYEAFLLDLKEVNVSVSEIRFIKVTDVIPEIQAFVLQLLDKGYAYKTEDGVYFSIEKYQTVFKDYGRLVGDKFLEGKKIGARVAVDEYEKDNLSDFVLWKNHNTETDAQIFWDHPVLGKGRPGWHIECSVINQQAFEGEATDIHTGGVDLIFPHHTNEIAQSQPIYKPYVNFWHHCEHLQVQGKKMAKRDGNVYLLSDLKAKGFSGNDLRYFFLTSAFQNQQNFTWDALLAVHNALERIDSRMLLIEKDLSKTGTGENKSQFMVQAADLIKKQLIEFDMPALLRTFNWAVDLDDVDKKDQDKILHNCNDVLGLRFGPLFLESDKLPEDLQASLKKREEARNKKDFTESDRLRAEIEVLGYEVLDTPEGQKIKRKVSL